MMRFVPVLSAYSWLSESTLNRCRALATKIANELRNKKPEHFVDKLSLAEVHASLERAADVLSTVKGSQVRDRQRHRAAM